MTTNSIDFFSSNHDCILIESFLVSFDSFISSNIINIIILYVYLLSMANTHVHVAATLIS